MRKATLLFFGLFFGMSLFGQAIPPYHVHPELSQGGIVQLSWEPGPVEGLNEDFEDGIAQDFEWWTPQGDIHPGLGYYTIENGHAQITAGIGLLNWGSAVYTETEFVDFTCEVEMVNTYYGDSHGIIFRTNGIKDNDFNGYLFEITNNELFGGMYSAWVFIDGLALNIIYFVWSDLINIGPAAYNTIKVVGVGDTFDFYINGTYVNSVTNPLYETGLVGFTNASGNTVQFYYITCSQNAEPIDRSVVPHRCTPVTEWLDEAGRPTNQPPLMWEDYLREHPELVTSRQPNIRREGATSTYTTDSELDEFVEYRIYRNGLYIGSSETETFTDQLPSYGVYEYRVTAYYDPEGESIPSVPRVVNWNPVTYSLAGVNTVVPWTGGVISYDAQLFNELPQSFANVTYKTYVTTPLGNVIGPTFRRTFTLAPGMSLSIPDLTQVVPPYAPPGNYFFHGRLYYQGVPVREQTFQFDKMGGGE